MIEGHQIILKPEFLDEYEENFVLIATSEDLGGCIRAEWQLGWTLNPRCVIKTDWIEVIK